MLAPVLARLRYDQFMAPVHCSERHSLLLCYRISAELFAWAVKRRRQSDWAFDPQAYVDSLSFPDYARAECDQSRLELERHTRSHGCAVVREFPRAGGPLCSRFCTQHGGCRPQPSTGARLEP